jgi:hypothetical protein
VENERPRTAEWLEQQLSRIKQGVDEGVEPDPDCLSGSDSRAGTSLKCQFVCSQLEKVTCMLDASILVRIPTHSLVTEVRSAFSPIRPS